MFFSHLHLRREMKLKRRTSKRVPLARKYNLETKIKAHNKKLKKSAKKLKASGVLANKKRGASLSAISIPNAWPHKRELLVELQQKKEEAANEKLEARRRRKAGLSEANEGKRGENKEGFVGLN